MRTPLRRMTLQRSLTEAQDEARLALRRAVLATLAGLSDMDRLLDQAERLIPHRRSDGASPACQTEASIPFVEPGVVG